MPTKLLLADDSVTIHKVVGLTFAAEDVCIETVIDGAQALDKARSYRPDILLADVFMPGMSGYQLCASVKADPELSLMPVVLLVGSFEPFDEEEASRVQCDAYLTKPFDTTELIKIVHHLVKQYHGARSVAAVGPAAEVVLPAAVVGGQGAGAVSAGLVTERTRASFLGKDHILELFDFAGNGLHAAGRPAESPVRAAAGVSMPSHVIPFPRERANAAKETAPLLLSEQTIDTIVERVVRRLSDKVVREIAWEVIPEISEIMIRSYIDEMRPKKA
jgi:CheY-like chemotaxis protein